MFTDILEIAKLLMIINNEKNRKTFKTYIFLSILLFGQLSVFTLLRIKKIVLMSAVKLRLLKVMLKIQMKFILIFTTKIKFIKK